MSKIITKWIGTSVTVTLRAESPALTGILRECDDAFVLIDGNTWQALVPMTSVLHIVPAKK